MILFSVQYRKYCTENSNWTHCMSDQYSFQYVYCTSMYILTYNICPLALNYDNKCRVTFKYFCKLGKIDF